MDKRFNKRIHDWSLKAPPGKWYSMDRMEMPREEFIDAVKFLIDRGYPLEFNADYTKVRREMDWPF